MSYGVDEVEAAVDAMILNVPPVETTLIPQVLLILLIHIVYHGLPAISEGGGGGG